jgi:hypothetical protein
VTTTGARMKLKARRVLESSPGIRKINAKPAAPAATISPSARHPKVREAVFSGRPPALAGSDGSVGSMPRSLHDGHYAATRLPQQLRQLARRRIQRARRPMDFHWVLIGLLHDDRVHRRLIGHGVKSFRQI